MIKHTLTLVVVILILVACTGIPSKIAPEQIQPVEQTEATLDGENTAKTTVVKDGKKYKKVCKTYATTGTRFKEKICRSQEAWDEIERKAKEALEKSAPMQSNNPTGG